MGSESRETLVVAKFVMPNLRKLLKCIEIGK